MKKEVILKIKSKFTSKFKAGYPLIFKEAIINIQDLQKEGDLLRLVDEKGHFLGRGYYGKQNKGVGWILSKDEKENINELFFKSKVEIAIERRKAFYNDCKTTAFRIFNGEGDGIGGFTIDYLDGYYLINWYSEGIYAFHKEIFNALKSLVSFKGIYQKKRFDLEGKYIEEDGFVMGERGEFPIVVKENNVNFAIYLDEGAMMGVFLDQREVRKKIKDRYAANKTVLNTFSYTGAFSIFAALGKAQKTTSVDLAKRSLQKTIEHFQINDLDYEKHEIVVQDVFDYFKYAVKKELKFDMVILDPPSFANSKKHTFSAAKDYKNLLKEVISITKDQGIIVASTNCSTFDMKKFKDFIHDAFKETKGKYKLVEEFSLPEDFRTIKEFPEGNYLKVVFIEKTK